MDRMPSVARLAAVAALAALPLPACGDGTAFRTDHGSVAGTGGATVQVRTLSLVPPEEGAAPAGVRPAAEIVLRFTGDLEEESARSAVRVED